VQAVLAAFPGAAIKDVRPPDELVAGGPAAPAEDDDDWDPFDPLAEER
jgi:hypothetical protein